MARPVTPYPIEITAIFLTIVLNLTFPFRYANRAKELASDGGNDDDVEYLSEEDISPQEEEEPVPSEPIPRTSVKAKSKAYKAYQQAAQDLENAEGDAIGWLDVQIETMHSLYSECVEAADYARSVDYDVKEFTDKFSKLEENMKKTSEVMSQFKGKGRLKVGNEGKGNLRMVEGI
uniref:DUF4094 domain-containing protein n=1 Tax=Bursaphelenchus xylophilus TaxID=6326 RepID=A0A1I7SK40_BURXY